MTGDKRMRTEETDDLESGWRNARFVLMDNHRITHGHAPTLQAARDRREKALAALDREVHIIKEDRAVVPEDADVDTLGMADLAAVHEALTADYAIMSGEADELDARRPHPPQDAYLYDVASALRRRAERAREVRDAETGSSGGRDE